MLALATGPAFGQSPEPEACPPAAQGQVPDRRAECLLEAAKAAYRDRKGSEALAQLDRLRALGLPDDSPVALEAKVVRARALFLLGRFPEMRDAAMAAWRMAVDTRGADDPLSLDSQALVAISAQMLGRPHEAVSLQEDLVARRVRLQGPSAPETLRARNNLASALRDAGRLEESATVFADLHASRLALFGPTDSRTVVAWHSLKSVEWEARGREATIREVERELPGQQQALGREHPEVVRLKALLATMLWSQGRLDEAHALFSEVLAYRLRTLGEAHVETSEARRNLAVVTLHLGDAEGALGLLAARSAPPEPSAGDAVSREMRQWMALAHLQRGNARQALELLAPPRNPDDSLKRRPPADVREAFIQARALSLLGRHAEAVTSSRRVLEAEEERLGETHPGTLMALRGLSTAQVEAGLPSEAGETLGRFVARSEARDGSLAGASDTHRRQLSQGIESLFQLAGYKTYVRLLAATDPARALEVAELAKGRSLAEAGTVSGRGQVARAETREAAWRLAKAEEALAANEPGSNAYLQAAKQRAEAEAKLRALRPAAGTTKRYGLADRLATLPKGAVFIDYVVDGDHVVALLAGKDLPVTGIDLGRVERLADTVEALRRLTASQDPSAERVWRTTDGYRWALSRPANATQRAKEATEIARFLSQKLLAPLAPHVGKSPRWILSPDGPLAFLPFELLEAGGKRVVESHEITIAPSLAVITAGKARAARVLAPGANREFLGIGVSRAGGDWPELPAAEREVAAVANLFPADRRVTLIGAQATEAAFAKLDASGDLERFRYIHLASHAFLSPRGSSLSGVVLAKDPSDAANDGIVTAAEWPVYRLRSDLVVLSACDTGRGTLLAGEGVMGLPYALLQAGTRDVLLTLWPVSDAAAADFMPRFYGRLRKGVPPPRALRETKLELARGRGPYAAPAHWAAFVLYGVP